MSRLIQRSRLAMFASAVAKPTREFIIMKPTLSHTLSLVAVAASLALTGCSTTQFSSTYKAPDAQSMHIAPGSKVGALVIYPDAALARSAEDALAAQLNQRGVVGVPAYSILGNTTPGDEQAVRAAFAKSGAVAVVVMRGVSDSTETVFRSPSLYTTPAYSSFWGGYYGVNGNPVRVPVDDRASYLATGKVVSVETLVYDLKTNKLVWSGHSRTVEPGNLGAFMKGIVDEVAAEMKKAGVI